MWITGKILEPLEEFNGHCRGPNPTRDEFDEFRKGFMKQPVFLEHKGKRPIGSVLEVFEANNKNILATLFVNDELEETKELLRDIIAGNTGGVSFAQNSHINSTNGVRQGKIVPADISIVKNGGVDKSRIVSYGKLNVTFLSKSGVEQVFTKSKSSNSKMSHEEPKTIPTESEAETMRKRANTSVNEIIPDFAEDMCDFDKAREYDKLCKAERQTLAIDLATNIQKVQSFINDQSNKIRPGTLEKIKEYSETQIKKPFHTTEYPTAIYVAASAIEAYKEVQAKFLATEKELLEFKKVNAKPQPDTLLNPDNRIKLSNRDEEHKKFTDMMTNIINKGQSQEVGIKAYKPLTAEEANRFQ